VEIFKRSTLKLGTGGMMVRKTVLGAAAAGVWLLVSGCVYSNVRVPMSGEFRNTQTVTRSGEATTRSVAWLVAWGDAGLQKAAENGGLKTLEYADHEFFNVLFGLYMSHTTVVYGQ
jgi:hypothetical protein